MSRLKDICLNCDTSLRTEDRFCPKCGIDAHEKNLSVLYNIKVFFNTFLNFDKKLIHSFTDIWIPNKITEYYIAGKRSRHVHPFRFFFISLVAFFAIISIIADDELDISNESDENLARLTELNILSRIEKLGESEPDLFKPPIIDSIRARVFHRGLQTYNDTLRRVENGVNYKKYGIIKRDYYELSADSLIKKYNVENKYHQLVIRQEKKIEQNEKGALKYFIHNMLWGVIVTTILMAGILYLLYVRHNSFFVEHILHMINFHIMGLILNTVLLTLHKFFGLSLAFTGFIWLFCLLFFLYALAKYYNQGFFKTFFKGIIFCFAYLIIFFFVIIFDLIISMAIF